MSTNFDINPEASIANHRRQQMLLRRQALVATWPAAWRTMLANWQGDGPDAVWLMYAANYLLRTGGVRWAIDPATLGNLVHEAAPVEVDELAALDFILLTHGHSDHVDRSLLRRLAKFEGIRWIVPQHMLAIAQQCEVAANRIVVPEPGKPLQFGEVQVTVFDGLHWEYASGIWGDGKPVAGIDATACLVEWGDRRLLFPGDTRTYDLAALPTLPPIDTLFAHVWLGRGGALDSEPPLLEAFCDFAARLAPRQRVFLTHLWQLAREPDDYWDETHAGTVQARLHQLLPGVDIAIPEFWQENRL